MVDGLDPRRAVQVISNGAGRLRLGSGYHVSSELVLTAEHVVAGVQLLAIRFVDGPGVVREVPGWLVWADASADLAVVRISARSVTLAPVQYGRLCGTAACEAVGYPWFKLRDGDVAFGAADPGAYRESHHARGVVSSHSNRRSGTLEMSVTAPLAHSDPLRSAWEGMSGAAVFADGLLVGVINENFGREGPGWLTARSVASWFPDPPGEHFEALHTLLALPKTGSLPEVGERSVAARDGGPRQLPADTAFFTGREEELDQLLALADRTTAGGSPGTVVISAINGLGGIGKTALAVHAAHSLADRFPDGQLYFDLCGFAPGRNPVEPGDALAALLASLGVSSQSLPPQTESRSALFRDRLADTRTLILLDNAADEEQLQPLLPGSGSCMVFVTSRRRLKALDDAYPMPLDVLPLGKAVALLAAASRLDPRCTDHEVLARLAELCGRLPLALLIAGALLRTGGKEWSLALLIDRLSSRRPGEELAGYTDETRSMAAVFDLSYRDLPTDLQRLFRCLGLVPGLEIDAYAAAALLDTDPNHASSVLQRLADHSLIRGASPGRYRAHELVRAYARSMAVTHDLKIERDAAIKRLLCYYQYTAQQAATLFARIPRRSRYGDAPAHFPDLADRDEAWNWLSVERANLEGAFDHAAKHGLDDHIIALAAGLATQLSTDGPWLRAAHVHAVAAGAAQRLKAGHAEAESLTDLGSVRQLSGDYHGAIDALSAALEISRKLEDRYGQASALAELGAAQRMTGDYPSAESSLHAALDISLETNDRRSQAAALSELGTVAWLTGNHRDAADAHAQALEAYREIGDRLGQGHALTQLGAVWWLTGDLTSAAGAQTEALEIFRAHGNRLGEANALNYLGAVLLASEDYPQAADTITQALNAYSDVGNRHGQANALTLLGALQRIAGDHSAAIGYLNKALETYREIGSRDNEAWALNHYAAIFASAGDDRSAIAQYRIALQLSLEMNKPAEEAAALEGIGEVLVSLGQSDEGESHLSTALAIFQRLGQQSDIKRIETRLASL